MNAIQKVHLSGYQARDYEVTDYQMYELADTGLMFRGPAPASVLPGDYFVCLGAAQTFGCFCDAPYPTLLSRALDLPVLNLGYGGAGPEFYERHVELDRFINNAKFVVIQVMSGRSQSNSLFYSGGLEYLIRRQDGKKVSAEAAYTDLISGSKVLGRLPPRKISQALARRLTVPRTRKVVGETRQRWIESHCALLERIKVPKVLLWFSKRSPDYEENYLKLSGVFGEFPQMINQHALEQVKPLFDSYVECKTSRGAPQRLISRFTGEPVIVDPTRDRPDLGGNFWTHDHYYPSPEMHEDAAAALLPVVRQLMSRN